MTLLTATGTVALHRGPLTLDLQVAAGEVVGLVGPNGAGKTATLLTLLGFHHLAEGSIAVSGRPVDDVQRVTPVHQRGLGWVPQAPTLLPRRRALRQVELFARSDTPWGSRGVAAVFGALGLEQVTRHRPHQLSGGETQRVALARAVCAASMVLLDEPAAAQDADGAQRVRTLIREHAQAGGGALVVAHRPEDAYAFADRLVVLERGAVVQTGSPSQLAAQPRTPYVAHVVGATVLHGTVDDDHVLRGAWGELQLADDTATGPASAVIHPGAVALHRGRPSGSSRNVWSGVVTEVHDHATGVTVRLDAQPPVVAALTHDAAADLDVRVGDEVWASVKANDVSVTGSSSPR